MKFSSLAKSASRLTNHEGAETWSMSPEMELYTAAVTSSLSPMTYEGEDERVARIAELVGKCDPTFVAQLAVYARTQMHLRSIPLLLAVELAKVHSGDSLVSRMVSRIVLRADEIMELLACYQWRNPHSAPEKPRKSLARLSRQIQAGLQQAFNSFDEYQFAKYDSDSRAVMLRDVLFLTHPKAKLYLFDLAGHGESPLSLAEKDVCLIAGWSDKVFDILAAIDSGSSAIAEIKKIEL